MKNQLGISAKKLISANMFLVAAILAGSGVLAEGGPVDLDFGRLVADAHTSYQTGRILPYVQHVVHVLEIHRLHELLRNLPSGVPRWDPDVRDGLCLACDFLVGNVIEEYYRGTPLEVIEEQAIELCVVFNLYPEQVCRGTVGLAGPDLADLLTHRNGTTGADMCTFALGARCGDAIWPKWEVHFPDKPKPPHVDPVLPEPSETTTVRILQISDPHADLEYTEGSNPDCPDPMCCRTSEDPTNTSSVAGRYGALAACDIPLVTLETALKWIVDNHPDIDIVYLTGDLPAHDIWNQTREKNLRSIRTGINTISKYFPDTPVFSSIGNHAPCFINEYPPESTTTLSNNITWLSSTFAELWPAMFDTPVSEGTILRGSYYSTRAIPGKLRVISINSNFCNNINWWLVMDSVDPSGELQWLVDQLQEAEDLGEKVHLLSHIPPGITDCLPIWSHQFNRIVNRYEDTIAAQFYGHTHKDELEVFYDLQETSRAVGVAYIAPALTTYSYLNPAYRIFTVDSNSTWMALDYETYVMDLALANSAGDTSFRRLYSARDDLVEAPLTPRNYDRLVQRMKSDDGKFQQYMRYFYHSEAAEQHYGPCTEGCRNTRICAAETSDSSNPHC